MTYSIELKVKFLRKMKLILILFIAPIIISISRENNYSDFQTIVALLLSVLVWTEVFHQVMIMMFRNYIMSHDNGKYFTSKINNILKQLLYFIFVISIYIVCIVDGFSLSTTLYSLIINLLLYKLTPKPIIVSSNFFICKNQIYILNAFSEFKNLEEDKIQCITTDGEEVILDVQETNKKALLESLKDILYINEHNMDHLEFESKKQNIKLYRIFANYIIVLLLLTLLTIFIVVEMILPVLSDVKGTEYFLNFLIILISLAGIINGFITRFITVPTKVSEFNKYKPLFHKSLQIILFIAIFTLAYYHIFKLQNSLTFFLANLLFIIYWTFTDTIYYLFIRKTLKN